jgi:hypothetical protein
MTMTAHHVVATPAGPVNYRPLAPGSERLPQGQRVWWQRSEVDCFRCCLATVFGCDYDEVPEGPGDGRVHGEGCVPARVWPPALASRIDRPD